jgi:hypothetical protein
MFQMQQMLSKAGKYVAVLFLSYGKPHQALFFFYLTHVCIIGRSGSCRPSIQGSSNKAALLLDHTISTLKKAPENIIIYGDSGGGNLATALMSHILHPHPSATTPIKPIIILNTPLRGKINML